MYIAAVRMAARVRLRRDRHPVPAGPEGHVRRLGPRRGAAQQPRPAAGRGLGRAAALRRARRAALQRGGRVRRRRRAADQPRLDRPRASTRRRRCTTCAGERRSPRAASTASSGSSRSPARRPARTSSAATAARAASASRRCTSRSGGSRSRASRSRARSSCRRVYVKDDGAAHGHRPRRRRPAPGRRDRAPLAGDDAAVADHARRALRRHARPDDGPAQGQPHPGRLRAGRRVRPTARSCARRRWRAPSASRSTSAATPGRRSIATRRKSTGRDGVAGALRARSRFRHGVGPRIDRRNAHGPRARLGGRRVSARRRSTRRCRGRASGCPADWALQHPRRLDRGDRKGRARGA